MKFSRSELEKTQDSRINISEELEFELDNHPLCQELRDVHAEGYAYYDNPSGQLTIELSVEGEMIVPCAITLKPLSHEFETRLLEVFSFHMPDEDDEDTIYIEGDELDFGPFVLGAILTEVPLNLKDPDLESYPEGDGWNVMTEEEYQKEKSEEIDPRLAKLKDLKID